ncbi:MAG: NAD(P)H-hydrate dehydratase [Promethearchaeota archaeon]
MRDFDRNISVKEMQILDKNSSDYGITPSTLMECAGYSAAQNIVNIVKKNDRVFIMCGTGNNGGDGFVIARHLMAAQISVSLFLVGHPDHIRTQEARNNWKILQSLQLNLQIYIVKDSSFFENLATEIKTQKKKCKVIVDCLVGTGIRGKVREPIRSAITFTNSFSEQLTNIISIDVPSGVDPDTEKTADTFVRPDILITFHRRKIGFDNLTIPKVIINPIGIPVDADIFIGSGDIQFTIPKRNKLNHKGQYGKVLIIGGSEQFSGAPALAGMAALQMGMDLVYIFAPKSVADVIRTYSPNLIVRSGQEKNICAKDVPTLVDLINKVDTVVIGPGLGTDPTTKKAFPLIISHLKDENIPLVIDANAITLSKFLKDDLPSEVIFTPHANEFYELTGKKLPDQLDLHKRRTFLEKNADMWKATFLVKGRYDFITNGKKTRINKTGVPEMAVGGTGDILAGILGSLLALKINSFDAACCAAFINGKLGEFYQSYHKGTIKKGTPLKSSDLLEFIPSVLKQY